MRPLILVALLGAAVLAAPPPDVAAPGMTGSTFDYIVVTGDSLGRLAARFGLSAATLARINGLAPKAIIHPGQRLLVDNRHLVPPPGVTVPIVMNVAQRMLYFRENGSVTGYPVAVGRAGWETPLGPFTIVAKEMEPTWDVPVSIQEEMRQQGRAVQIRVSPGPDNPLGRYFVRLSFSGIGIHGTNRPSSIFTFSTHGCIRMGAADINAFFSRAQIGMRGVSIYEPVLMNAVDGRVFLEVHPDVYRRRTAPLVKARELAAALGVMDAIDWEQAAAAIRQQGGIATDVTRLN